MIIQSLVTGRKNGRLYFTLFLIACLAVALVLFRMSSSLHESSSNKVADHVILANLISHEVVNGATSAMLTEPDNNDNSTEQINDTDNTSNEIVVLKVAIANNPSLLDNPIIKILVIAKVHNITSEEFQALPQTARNFQSLYYHSDKTDSGSSGSSSSNSSNSNSSTDSSPIIIGLERCKEYRDQIAPDIQDRYAAVAGMFNTGSNAFGWAMMQNLKQQHKFVSKLPCTYYAWPFPICLNAFS
jgi:hypothetical protein